MVCYDRNNPFFAQVKECYSLTGSDSSKEVYHLSLDLTGSGIGYNVGDSIGVQAVNPLSLVEKTLIAMRANPDEKITDKRTGCLLTVQEFLTKSANLSLISKKMICEVANRQSNFLKKENLFKVLESKDLLKKYLGERQVWDFLEENSEVLLTCAEVCNYLMPLLPRFYSIASSQKVVGDEVHLTVASLKYNSNGKERLGVCSNFLCNSSFVGDGVVPLYIQSHKGFTLPKDSSISIIMVGPGTGVAPFRGFMQERILQRAAGKNWLFFGECNRLSNFFYESEWKAWEKEGRLKLDVAFSRDQAQKVYVQHLMLDRGKMFFDWLQSGAYLYVCGDADKMARDVDVALHQIVCHHGKLREDDSKEWVKNLRKEGRYLRDVY